MPYNVTQTYTYTGDSVFDSAGTFKAWYHAVDSDFKVAVETATGTAFNQALFDVKQAQPVTETWDVDEQKLIKTIAWADQATYEEWNTYMTSFDYNDSAFNAVTVGNMPNVADGDQALDVILETTTD